MFSYVKLSCYVTPQDSHTLIGHAYISNMSYVARTLHVMTTEPPFVQIIIVFLIAMRDDIEHVAVVFYADCAEDSGRADKHVKVAVRQMLPRLPVETRNTCVVSMNCVHIPDGKDEKYALLSAACDFFDSELDDGIILYPDNLHQLGIAYESEFTRRLLTVVAA